MLWFYGSLHYLKEDYLTGYKEEYSPHEDSQHLEQVAQKLYAIYILGVFEDQIVSSPEQPGLTSHLTEFWAGGWAGDLLRDLQPELPQDPITTSSRST